jgi:lysozyme family protein
VGIVEATESDIVVAAWSPRFRAAGGRVLGIEGGHVNDPSDRGGETKYGVSLRFLVSEGKVDLDGDGFADFDLDMDGDIDGADIRALKPNDALSLFHRCFWKRLGCDDLPAPLGEAMFDQGVNGGLTAARKLLQRALNAASACVPAHTAPLLVDGQIGPATRALCDLVLAAPGCGMSLLIQEYREAAADRYRAIVAADPSQQRFLKGWLRRAAELGK